MCSLITVRQDRLSGSDRHDDAFSMDKDDGTPRWSLGESTDIPVFTTIFNHVLSDWQGDDAK
jgi:hypothetical protein